MLGGGFRFGVALQRGFEDVDSGGDADGGADCYGEEVAGVGHFGGW